ncbi:MAG: diguanylate cyclase [Candidatus Aureabacteria bacterium]|nr:diguanylate cyclase [Candidatus Auribacterota bacterium]
MSPNPNDLNALETQVLTDDLTGLYNRRYLNLRLQQEIERSRKKGLSFCLVMMDLDHFKEVNDTYGHREGDQALLWFSDILRQSVRSRDIVIRFAGDEFFLILPDTSLNEAKTVVQRVFSSLLSNPFKGTKNHVKVMVGTSCGIAIFPDDAACVEDLIQSADKGLYLAKEKGRGIACLASEARQVLQQSVSPTVLFHFPFVGRENELKELKKNCLRIRDTKQSVFMLLKGDSGMGKTRILTELLHEIGPDVFVLHSRCLIHEVEIPFQPLIDLLMQWFEKNKGLFLKLLSDLSKKEQKEIMKLLPEMDLPHKRAGQESGKDPEGLPYLYYGITHLLKSLSQHAPCVVIIEDIHWIDSATAEFISHLVQQSTQSQMAVICTCPFSKEKSSFAEFYKWMKHLERITAPVEIILSALKADAVRKLIYKLFHTENPEDLAEIETVLLEQGEGNPLFIREILFKMIQERILFPGSSGWSVDKCKSLALPEKIKDLILEQMEGLSDDIKNILQIASVIGNRFSFEFLKSISEKNEGYLLDILDEAVSHGILEEITDSKTEQYQFISPNIRRVLSLPLSQTRQRRLHLKIVEHAESELTRGKCENPEFLFYHSLEARITDKAFRYGVESAVKNHDKHASREAKKLFEQVLPLWEELDEENKEKLLAVYHQALFCYGDVLTLLGEYNQAIKIIGSLPDTPFSKHALGTVHFKLGHYSQSLKLLEKASEETIDSLLKSRIESLIADVYYHEGLYLEAERHGKNAWHWSEKAGNPSARALAFKTIGNAYFSRDRYQEALQYYKKSLQQYKLDGDISGISSCYNNIALIYYHQKKYRLAEKGFLYAKQFSEEIGDLSLRLHILNNLGNVYYAMDLLKQAEQSYSQCLSLSQEIGERSISIAAYSNLGNLYLSAQPEKAELYYTKALDLCRTLGEASREAQFLALLGDLYYQQKDFPSAEEHYLQSISLHQKLGEFENELYSRMNLLHLYEETGKNSKLAGLLPETEERIFSLSSLRNKTLKKEWEKIKTRNIDFFRK